MEGQNKGQSLGVNYGNIPVSCFLTCELCRLTGFESLRALMRVTDFKWISKAAISGSVGRGIYNKKPYCGKSITITKGTLQWGWHIDLECFLICIYLFLNIFLHASFSSGCIASCVPPFPLLFASVPDFCLFLNLSSFLSLILFSL